MELKIYSIFKKAKKDEIVNKEQMRKIESKQQIGKFKPSHIANHTKCK